MTAHLSHRVRTLLLQGCGPLAVLLAALGPQAATGAPRTSPEPTLKIEKTLPADIPTVNAPDTDHKHYRTQDGTHFSYRCYDPYTAKTRQAAVEVCEIDPVRLQILGWPETEFINIVKGQVTVTELDGTVKDYAEGDVFVLPRGFKGTWHQAGALTKIVVRHPLYWKN